MPSETTHLNKVGSFYKSMDKGADNYYQPFIYAGDRKFNEGDTEEAIEYYDHALNIKPLSSVYLKNQSFTNTPLISMLL